MIYNININQKAIMDARERGLKLKPIHFAILCAIRELNNFDGAITTYYQGNKYVSMNLAFAKKQLPAWDLTRDKYKARLAELDAMNLITRHPDNAALGMLYINANKASFLFIRGEKGEEENSQGWRKNPPRVVEKSSKGGGKILHYNIHNNNSYKDNSNEHQVSVFKNTENLMDRLIDYLNEKTNSKLQKRGKQQYLKPLLKVIKELRTEWPELAGLTDFQVVQRVIDQQTKEWLKNDKMRPYLVPETLFRPSKFKKYMVKSFETGPDGSKTNISFKDFDPTKNRWS